MPAKVPRYPPAYNATYVKATSYYSEYYYPWFGVDPSLSLIGTNMYTSWITSTNAVPQKFNVDFDNPIVLGGILFDNYHHNGGGTNSGVKTLRIYGTNSSTAFDNVDGWDTTDLSLLSEIEVAQHIASNSQHTQIFNINNTSSYRYFSIIVVDNYGNASFYGFRHITFQSLEETLFVIESEDKFLTRVYVQPKLAYPKYAENILFVTNLWDRIIKNSYTSPSERIIITNTFTTAYGKVGDLFGAITRPVYNIDETRFMNYNEGYIAGIVTVSGSVWPNVTVRLYYNVNGMLISTAKSGDDGYFRFNTLEYKKDFYTVVAFKEGYNAIVYDNVAAEGTAPIVVPIPSRPVVIGGWTPAQVTTYLWLDADDANTVILDGSSVSEWQDKSTNAFIMHQGNTASKPTISIYNGRNILSLDGNDTLSSTVLFPLTGDTAFTVFIVYKKAALAGGNAYGWGSSLAGGSFGLYDEGAGTAQYAFYSASYTTSDVPTNVLHIACVTKSASAGPMFAYRDSVFCGNNYNPPPSINIASNVFVVGRWAQYGTALTGTIAEIIVFNYFVNNPDRFKFEGYLANKWALLDSLPSTHPFKSGAVLDYVSKFPTTFSSTYIKSTSDYGSTYLVQFVFDNTKPLVGHFDSNVWLSSSSAVPQKLCVDYVTAFVPKRIYVDNLHHYGNSQGHTSFGIKTLEIYGSNSATAFNNAAAPSDLSNLTLIETITLRAHIAQDISDPQIFDIDCDVYYRYIIYRITEALVAGQSFYGIRHMEIQELLVATALWDDPSTEIEISENGTRATVLVGGDWRSVRTSKNLSAGKIYWEILTGDIAGFNRFLIGIATSSLAENGDHWYYMGYNGEIRKTPDFTLEGTGATFTSNTTIGIAVDINAGQLFVAKNNIWQLGSNPSTGTGAMLIGSISNVRPFVYLYDTNTYIIGKFSSEGQLYAPPSGFTSFDD